MMNQFGQRSQFRSRRRYWRSNPPKQSMTYQKRKFDRVKMLHAQYDRDQKWKQIMQVAPDRVGEVRHLFEAVGDADSPGVSPEVLEEAMHYLMGEYDEKPSCIPTAEEFSRRDAS